MWWDLETLRIRLVLQLCSTVSFHFENACPEHRRGNLWDVRVRASVAA